MALRRSNKHFAVEGRLECGVDAAFRHPLQVGLAQGHRDDVEPVVSRRADDLAGQAEPGKHTVRVVVGASADVGHHACGGLRAERPRAQRNRVPLKLLGIAALHQHLHFPAGHGHRGDVVLHHLDVRCADQTTEGGHAVR